MNGPQDAVLRSECNCTTIDNPFADQLIRDQHGLYVDNTWMPLDDNDLALDNMFWHAGDHRVEYHLNQRQMWLIWTKHASRVGALLGKSQFYDYDDIPSLVYKAVTRSEGHHQYNGYTRYEYENDIPVGTYPDGTPTSWVTVITLHAPGASIGLIINAFPGLPGFGK